MIVAENLGKQWKGFSLQNVTFQLPKGYILGLIGENGAGKTTLLKLLLNVYVPTEGEILLDGRRYQQEEEKIKQDIGFVMQEDLFIPGFTLEENGDYYGKYYERFSKEQLLKLLHQFTLNEKDKFGKLSKGEKLKFQFAFALSHKPRLLILDEPTANFDREFRAQFLKLITEFIADGEKSVVMATHNTQDLDQIADYIGFLHQGKMVLFTDRKSLENRYRIVQGERYRIKNLPKQDCIYIEEKKYSWKALMRHRRWGNYEKELEVHVPTIEELMCCLLKANEGKHGEFLC